MYINYCYVIGEYFRGMKKVELNKYICIGFQFVTVNFTWLCKHVMYSMFCFGFVCTISIVIYNLFRFNNIVELFCTF